MSRAQQGAIESTETGASATSTTSATQSQQQEQEDINTGESQLAKAAANNPYVQGGQFQTAENQQLSNTADATAKAAAAKNQQQAQRTGQNASAGVAAGEAEQQEAQRTLSGQEGAATQQRIGSEATYNQDLLKQGTALTAEQAALSSNLTGEAQGQESTAEQAAQTPSFLDELGNGLITGADDAAGAFGKAKGCWIAAELYDGWDDPRVHTLRAWLFGPFREYTLGRILTSLYVRYGVSAANLIQKSRATRVAFKVIFDRALVSARKWEAGG